MAFNLFLITPLHILTVTLFVFLMLLIVILVYSIRLPRSNKDEKDIY